MALNLVKSNDTMVIEDLLSRIKIGESVTYDSITKAIGRSVQREARGLLQTARKSLEKQGIVFGVQTGVGLIRLNAAETVESVDEVLNRARRAARRGRSRLERVDVRELDDTQRKSMVTRNAQLAAVELLSGKQSGQKLLALADNKDAKSIAVQKTLAFLAGNKEA